VAHGVGALGEELLAFRIGLSLTHGTSCLGSRPTHPLKRKIRDGPRATCGAATTAISDAPQSLTGTGADVSRPVAAAGRDRGSAVSGASQHRPASGVRIRPRGRSSVPYSGRRSLEP
jgi:hypothetical protein